MTKTWALGLLKHMYPFSEASVPFPGIPQSQVKDILRVVLQLYKGDDMISHDIAKMVRQAVQNRVDPISRHQWVYEYSTTMHKLIIGDCDINYCTESAQNAMDELRSGEWMVVSPADAVQGEMECWND